MYGRPQTAEANNRNDFRVHRNRRKSRLGKFNADVDKRIPLPSSFVSRRTIGCRMNQVLYQEATIQRQKEAARTNPRKYLFPEPTDENTDYGSFRIQKSALISTRPGFSSVEDPDVTDIFPIDDHLKLKHAQLGGNNMAPSTSGLRLPLKDQNFQSATPTARPGHQEFKDGTKITDFTRKYLVKQPAPWNWNVVESPVSPKLSSFPGTKTHAQYSRLIKSPVMPELSTFSHSIKTSIKTNIIPPVKSEENESNLVLTSKTIVNNNLVENDDWRLRSSNLKSNFNVPVSVGTKDSSTELLTFPNFKYPVTESTRDQLKISNFNLPAKGELSNSGSNLSKSPSNFNFPVTDSSKHSHSDPSNLHFSISAKFKDSNVSKQMPYSEKEESREPTGNKEIVHALKSRSPVVVNDKMNRLKEKQKKMSLSEMEFEKICKMKSEGSPMQSMIFLSDFCPNEKSNVKQNKGNDIENRKEVNEIIRAKESTNKNVKHSVSSYNPNENGDHHSKLKQPQQLANKVDKKILQPSGTEFNHIQKYQTIDKESPNFVIHKRKESFPSNDTCNDDSFDNFNNITNNYESSTLIVNDRYEDVDLKEVENIDDALSSFHLNDVGRTFVVENDNSRKLFDDNKSCEVNKEASNVNEVMNDEIHQIVEVDVRKTCLTQSNSFRRVLFDNKRFHDENHPPNLKVAGDAKNQSIDVGVDMLNESLDTTLTFIHNETLCNSDNVDNEVTLLKNSTGKIVSIMIDVEKIDVNKIVEETDVESKQGEGKYIKSIGEENNDVGNMSKVQDDSRLRNQTCLNAVLIQGANNESEKKEPCDMSKLKEKHRLLVKKGEDLFTSRREIMTQIKALEQSLLEQEHQFSELNREFCDLCREFGAVVGNQQNDTLSNCSVKNNVTVSVSMSRNNDTVSASNLKNNVTVSTSVVVPFSVSKTTFDTPRSARRVRKNLVFSQLKSDFSCLKTPLPSTTKKLQESTANKTILTPKSMSVCIQDQVNQLFDS